MPRIVASAGSEMRRRIAAVDTGLCDRLFNCNATRLLTLALKNCSISGEILAHVDKTLLSIRLFSISLFDKTSSKPRQSLVDITHRLYRFDGDSLEPG